VSGRKKRQNDEMEKSTKKTTHKCTEGIPSVQASFCLNFIFFKNLDKYSAPVSYSN
jgi:hypothetical protein